ncbi:MAG: ARMT1-like domain-containing protein [Candidatus Omnitrophica bacterium]|nr:ARMT1-like domain-containing protein [Candidatus Omnitrophota bacterium]
MNTYLDCIPCFFRQILEGARLSGAGPRVQKQIIDAFARKIPYVSLTSSPPEIARLGYILLRKACPHGDPYKEIKRESNRLALGLFGKIMHKLDFARDRLLVALQLAVAGNIIDFGAKNNLDVRAELQKILAKEPVDIHRKSKRHYLQFRRTLRDAKNIMYLADNAGEVVFDRVLIEEILRMYPGKNICYAVKAKPVANDALRADAYTCGIHKVARVISNGTDAPGTLLALCSKQFKGMYRNSDMIISKGQGNFESLSKENKPIFFLFMVKCPVVAKETGCRIGEAMLACSPQGQWKY